MKHHRLSNIVRIAILATIIGGGNALSQQKPPSVPPVPAAPPQAVPPPAPPGTPVPGGGRPPGAPSGQTPRRRIVMPQAQPQPVPTLTQGDYSYTVNDKHEATIVGFNKDFKGDLTILDTLGGCPVSGISSSAFGHSPGITRIKIPASVASIADAHGTFANCSLLTAIEVAPDNKNYSSRDGVLFNKEQTTLIRCPLGKSGSYAIPAGVTQVTDKAFMNCSGLTGITVPASVTSIGETVFADCSGLKVFNVDSASKTYSSMDGLLFDKGQARLIRCPERKAGSYTIPDSVTSIGKGAFENCIRLTHVTISPKITGIWDGAFSGCSGLRSFTIPARLGNQFDGLSTAKWVPNMPPIRRGTQQSRSAGDDLQALAEAASNKPQEPKLPKDGLLAHFPLRDSFDDESNSNAKLDVRWAEFRGGALYLNGIYGENAYGVSTTLPNLSRSKFTVALHFWPIDINNYRPFDVVFMFGHLCRWFGVEIDPNGALFISANNGDQKFPLDITVKTRQWHYLVCSLDLEKKRILTSFDGKLTRTIELPQDFAFPNRWTDNDFSFTNRSNGGVFHGFISDLRIYGRSFDVSEMPGKDE